mgnify:FL=1
MSKENKETHTVKDFIREHKVAIAVAGASLAIGVLGYAYFRGAADAVNSFKNLPGGQNLWAMLGQASDDPVLGKIIDHADQVEYLGATNGDGIAILYNTKNIEQVAKVIRSGAVSNTDLGPLAEAILQGLKN